MPFLGEIPIDPRVAECGDKGEPIVHRLPNAPVSKTYLDLATAIGRELGKAGKQPTLPTLQI